MKSFNRLGRKIVPVVAASSLLLATATPVSAATLTDISVTPSNAAKAATGVTYTAQVSNVTLSTIRCMKVEFDTAFDGTGGKPTGLDVSTATFAGTSNIVPTPANFTAANDNATGIVTLTDTTGQTPASASARTIALGSITNPTNAGTYYVIVSTFTNADCTSPIDNGAAAFAVTDAQAVTVNVDPSFSFIVNSQPAVTSCNGVTSTVASTSTAVAFGRVAAGNNAIGVQQLQVDSNASGGYVVYARTTGVLTAAGGTIPDFASTTPAAFPASTTAAFGYTSGDANLTTAFASGTYAGNLATVASPGAEVAKGPSGVTYTADQTCVGYRVNVAGSTKAGAYSTSLIYTAVPTF